MMTDRLSVRSRLSAAIPILSAAVLLAGCGERIDKNPLFKDQIRLTERLEEDAKAMTWQVDELVVEVKNLKQQMGAMKQGPTQIAPAQLKPLEDRITALEVALAESRTQLAAMKSAPPATERRVAKRDSETPVVKLDEAKGEDVSPAHSGNDEVAAVNEPASKPKTQATRDRVSPVADPAQSPSLVARGYYHLVKNGETFELIAQRNKIPVNTLLAANKIPAGRNLFAGQQLYVPATY